MPTVSTGGDVALTIQFGDQGNTEQIQVALTGAIDDIGTATQSVSNTADGQTGTMTITLQKGSISGSFVESGFELNMDAAACTAAPTSRGNITIDSGTGAYAGASGSLSFNTLGTIIGAKDASGTCLGESVPPVSSSVELTGTGRIELAG